MENDPQNSAPAGGCQLAIKAAKTRETGVEPARDVRRERKATGGDDDGAKCVRNSAAPHGRRDVTQ